MTDDNHQRESRQGGRVRFSDDGASGAAQLLVDLDRVNGASVLSIEGELDLYTSLSSRARSRRGSRTARRR